jgi:uncharacterized protein
MDHTYTGGIHNQARSSNPRVYLLARCCAALLLFCGGAQCAQAGPPSFLCSKAKTWLEKTVCKSDRLSALDLEAAVAYARVLKVVSGSAERAFTGEQNKWWAARNLCQKDKDPDDCLAGRYEARIAELKGRPDYPGDEPHVREEFSEALIKEAGKGWAQNMSAYMRAIRACVGKAAPRPRAVLAVWTEEEGELVGMRLRAGAGEDYMCIAKKDGTQANVRKREPVETVPEAGPILWLGAAAAPKEACGKPLQVLDTDDTPVGWLADGKC